MTQILGYPGCILLCIPVIGWIAFAVLTAVMQYKLTANNMEIWHCKRCRSGFAVSGGLRGLFRK